MDAQYLRARYYSPGTVDFLTEDSYLGNLRDSLTLNRYSYVKSSPLNYIDPSGCEPLHPNGDPNSFELPKINEPSNAEEDYNRLFVEGYDKFSISLEDAMGRAMTLSLADSCDDSSSYSIVRRTDINGIGLEKINGNGYILFGNNLKVGL